MPADDIPIAQPGDRDLLAAAVREAGALALKTFRGPLRQWIKGQSSPVSEADIAVDELLRERLSAIAATHGWLSEETEDDPRRLQSDAVWIVDPIDGTRSYLAGREDWVISVALAARGRPVLAAIFAPVTDEMFLAMEGAGATCNGEPILASREAGFEGARLVGPKRFQNGMAKVHPTAVPLPRIGSLALRLVRVAHDAVDVAFAGGNSHDWDLAAADLLVHEAGGVMTDLEGERLVYNRPDPIHRELVAAGRARHAAMLALLREHKVDFS
ncbi:MAG: 3'(2'),5'-bisphosphate nucleotidase CysQ [Xanthobacteraceae bacterium]